MIDNERIIVSMTSYPKRITNVGKAIFFLLTKQTVKPNEIHLWLAEPEFPNKEKDLPVDLNNIISASNNVFLHWLPKNIYAHKKHEYFKICKENDCIFLVDDDVRYADNLIATCMNAHKKFPNTIISYNHYSLHKYDGKKILYIIDDNKSPKWLNPRYDTMCCTQCMIPAKIYPKECLSPQNEEIRDKICPLNDEVWFDPFRVKNNIPIFHLNYNWGIDISDTIKHSLGLCIYTKTKRDEWLESILNAFPEIKKIYEDKYGYMK